MGLFLLRLVTGALATIFAARELADRSEIILKTLEGFQIGSADIVQVFIGCAILFIGVLVLIGFWTRIMALALLLLLVVGSYSWPAQESHLYFQFQALYGALFLYLSLAGGGNWAVSRPVGHGGQSFLDAEPPSSLARDDRPSIFQEMDEEIGETQEAKDKVEDTEEGERDDNGNGEDPKPMDPLPSL